MEEKKSFLKQKIDLESPNRNIVPITTSIGRDGKLSVGGCSIEELVKKHDSPLYILDEITLRKSCRAYKKALEKYYPGESLPIYASKANSSIFMSNLVSSEGLGLDAVSEGELLTALKGGVPNEKIVFHGNNKSDKEIDFAIRNDIKIIVDNDYDLRRLEEVSNSLNHDLEIMIRFTPGIECHTHEYIKTGSFDSKFGFGIENLNILFSSISNTKHLKLIINVINEQKTQEIKKLRDKSIILIGFGGGFRRTELISIDHEDLEFVPEGLKITIKRSKTDQFGEGMTKGLPYFDNEIYCPVTNLKKWLEISKIKSGPIFTRFSKGLSLTKKRLTDQSVVLLMKEYLKLAGIENKNFSGHSLRSGFATVAADSGADERSIMAMTGHKTTQMVRRYIREANIFKNNALNKIKI